MDVIVVGVSFRSAPIQVLEKATMEAADQGELRERLLAKHHVTEAMIVTTCNRVECYCVVEAYEPGLADVLAVMAEHAGMPVEELVRHAYVHYAGEAARHMLAVTAGLDSLVVGEQQIIGQVRQAFTSASEAGHAGPVLHELGQTALHAGKRVHTETTIDKVAPSLVTHALGKLRAEQGWQDFAGKKALIIGAGAMATLAATYLGNNGISGLIITNRTRDRAETLSSHAQENGVAAEVVDWGSRAAALGRADVIVSATGFAHYTVTAADCAAAGIGASRTSYFVDLSLPRDIDPDVPGYLLSIANLGGEDADTSAADAIVSEELASYLSNRRMRDVAPALAALREYAGEIVAGELERFRNKNPDVSAEVAQQVANTVQRTVDKLLHTPTVQAKRWAASGEDAAFALSELFGLEEIS